MVVERTPGVLFVVRSPLKMKNTRIHERLQEADTGAMADSLGTWWKNIDPNAGPGKKGYMRKRNVPPPGAKYDPTKHKRPVEGEPLEYMQPQHKDYTSSFINSRIMKSATRDAIRGTPTTGNIHKNSKIGKALLADKLKKGREILKGHGVPNPSLSDKATKWIKGNNPRSKENPEGYVRSDRT